jgi:hypothetical protein
MIVWINGTHGAGKTTTGALVQQLIPDSRVFDAEKVGETLMDITPGLPETNNFQHWPPWRQLVVETARRVLDYTGGTLVMPMTVLVEQYWREISTGLARHAIPVRHFVLHADPDTLRGRIEREHAVPSPFRLSTEQFCLSQRPVAIAWPHVGRWSATPWRTSLRVVGARAARSAPRGPDRHASTSGCPWAGARPACPVVGPRPPR